MLKVELRYLEMIRAILDKHLLNCQVWAFGSRVKGHAKKYSDLDLVVVGKEKIPGKVVYLLKDEFQESDLPFRVELLDYNALSEEFKKVILDKYEVIWPAKDRETL